MGDIPEGWRKVRLKEVIHKVYRQIEVQPDELYSQIGIRSHGKGIFHKEPVTGEEIGKKRIFWIEPNDFVLNIVFAWEGAVALVSKNETGMCASHRFPSFIAKAGICDIRYIHRYFQTHQGIWQLGLTSPGGAGRNKTLNQSDFLDIQILLPPFKEQERIADIIDTWDEAIALTNALIKALQQRKKGLMQKLLTGEIRFPGFDDAWEEVRIDDVARVNPPKPKNLDENTVVSFVGMADVSEDARLTTKESRPYSEVSSGFTPFRDMDILIAKITPCLENGKGALVNGLDNGLGFGSTEFHVVRAKAEKTFPEFLYYHTVSHNFRGRGELNMVGSAGQKRVPTDYVRAYRFPIPTLAEQKKIIASLSDADDGINLYKLYVTELQQQKKGLMQQLLTGQVQVKGMDYVRVLHK